MTEYVVAVAALGVPTGRENPLTRLPDFQRFVKGQIVDSEDFDTKQGRNKIERLLQQGALRDPKDTPQGGPASYKSPFDIPLDRDPGGQSSADGIIRLEGDDIEDDDEDDTEASGSPDDLLHPAPTEQVAPSLTDGTPEARLAGDAVESGDDGVLDNAPLPEPPSRGASTAVWQQYAQRARLDVSEDASRAEIQDAYDRAVSEQG